MSTRWLFLDMNAFFASVEQQEDPSLRGKPVIVAPVKADTTCAIAASYEAKAFGIRTGTSVRDAKERCPHLIIVEGHHDRYREYHHRIVDVVRSLFATVRVLSVDEMACRLSPLLPETERQIGMRVKQEIGGRVGDWLKCSVGIAPNVFLAKVASETVKPDGLTIWRGEDLPKAAFCLTLRDLPGIGASMHARLQSRGIHTVEQLFNASAEDLWRATGSVVGKRWHLMLRGSQEVDYGLVDQDDRKTVGHSHVLPPDMRTPGGAEQVLLRLLSKALKRLRTYRLAAGSVFLSINYYRQDETGFRRYAWKGHSSRHHPIDDDVTWTGIVRGLIRNMGPPRPGFKPLKVAITFSSLMHLDDLTPSLFGSADRLHALAKAADELNARFGYRVDLASVYWLKGRAPDRISFGTSLLNSGELVNSAKESSCGRRSISRTGGGDEADPEPDKDGFAEGIDYETDSF